MDEGGVVPLSARTHTCYDKNMKTAESAVPKTAAVFVDVKALTPWAKNPRKNDPAVKAVADSIKRFGFGAPLLARQANGEIIAGHTRLKAAIKLGLTEVPVRYLDLTESEAHALALADNKVGELAEWDDAVLAEVLKGMAAAGNNIEGLGWSSADVNDLLNATQFAPSTEGEQPDLGQRLPKIVTCPECGHSWDTVHVQG